MARNTMRFAGLAASGLCLMVAGCATRNLTANSSGQISAGEREQIAAAAAASGNEQLALSVYAKAAAAAPRDAGVQLRYADLLARTGQIGAARAVLTKSLRQGADPVDIRRGLGTLDALTGRSEEAIVTFDRVLAARPKDVRAIVDKAVALDLLGRHADAQPLYRQALALTPDDPAIANDLALSYALQKRLTEARAVLSPFAGQTGLPERMQVTMRLLFPSDAPGEATAGNEELQRLQIALGTAPCAACTDQSHGAVMDR